MYLFQDALRVMGLLAVIVNSALIGVSGQMTRMTPDLDSTSRILVILVLEVCNQTVTSVSDIHE